ncbi:uncharacterized protein si:dkeyp-117h8.4 isoform X2 [Eleginops maclovinus]
MADLREEPERSKDITGNTQLDSTNQDCRADDCAAFSSISLLSLEDDGVVSNETTHLTAISLDEIQRNMTLTEFQPEDQDEELEMTLKTHGSSLMELYPGMISRLGEACRRQKVSEAAISVLRRYRRWRQQSNRSNLNKTFNVTLKHTNRKPKNMTNQTLLEDNSPVKRQLMVTKTTPQPPLQMVNKIQDWQAQLQSPEKVTKEPNIVVMDFDCFETSVQTATSLNETFIVSEASQLEKQPSTYTHSASSPISCYPAARKSLDTSLRSYRHSLSDTPSVKERVDIYGSPVRKNSSTYTFSPSRPCYPAARSSLDTSLRSRRHSLSANLPQTNDCSVYAPDTSPVKERLDVYSSPVRKSSSTYTFSPSRPCYPAARSSLDTSLRSRRHSLSANLPQTNDCSVYAPDTSPVKERLDVYSSPVRKSSSTYTFSPSRPCYPAARSSLDTSLRSRRHSLSANLPQTNDCSVYAPDTSPIKERLDVYSSPVRKSSSTYTFSPSRPCYPAARSSLDTSLRSRRHSLSANLLQTNDCSSYAPDTSPIKERLDVYSSPVRKSSSTYTFSPSRPCYPAARSSLDTSLRSRRHSLSANLLQTNDCSSYAPDTSPIKERLDVYSSPVRKSSSTYTFSPSRPCYPAARSSLDTSLRSRRHSLSANLLQTNDCSSYAPDTSPIKERLDVYSSPVRKSSLQATMVTGLRSPHVFSRSPRRTSVESFSSEPIRPRLMSTPPKKPTVPLRMLHSQDLHLSPHQQLRSPQLASAPESRNRIWPRLFRDSTLTPQKEFDEDFLKAYHKFVCQNTSSLMSGISCYLCAGSAEARKGSSSSALAALALSPHRSLLRKRNRELNLDHQPQSKRLREEYCQSSPGSQRHRKELLRRRLSTYDMSSPMTASPIALLNPACFKESLPNCSPQKHIRMPE